MGTWSISPIGSAPATGASVDNNGNVTFQKIPDGGTNRSYSLKYKEDGYCETTKTVTVEANPERVCTFKVISNILGSDVSFSNGATGTIPSYGELEITARTADDGLFVTLSKSGCTYGASSAQTGEGYIPCNGNVTINGQCDPSPIPPSPEDPCKYVATDSHTLFADCRAYGANTGSGSNYKCDSVYFFKGATTEFIYEPTTASTWLNVKLTHQFDDDFPSYTCSPFTPEPGGVAFRLQDKLGLPHNAADTNLGSLFFIMSANNTGVDREATVRYKIDGHLCSESMHIKQAGCNSCAATTSGIGYAEQPASGGTHLKVGTYSGKNSLCGEFRAIEMPSWVSNMTYEGGESGTIYADIAPNPYNEARSGRYTSIINGVTKSQLVSQAANTGACTCAVTGTKTPLPAKVSSTEIDVGTYTSTCSGSWTTPTLVSGEDFAGSFRFSGGHIYAKAILENTSSSERTSVYKSQIGTCEDTFSIKQSSSTPTACTCANANLVVTGSSISYKAATGKTIATFTAECNPGFAVSSAPSWLTNVTITYNKTSKVGTVTANVAANSNTSSRTATMYITCGSTSKSFTVSQGGKQSTTYNYSVTIVNNSGKRLISPVVEASFASSTMPNRDFWYDGTINNGESKTITLSLSADTTISSINSASVLGPDGILEDLQTSYYTKVISSDGKSATVTINTIPFITFDIKFRNNTSSPLYFSAGQLILQGGTVFKLSDSCKTVLANSVTDAWNEVTFRTTATTLTTIESQALIWSSTRCSGTADMKGTKLDTNTISDGSTIYMTYPRNS